MGTEHTDKICVSPNNLVIIIFRFTKLLPKQTDWYCQACLRLAAGEPSCLLPLAISVPMPPSGGPGSFWKVATDSWTLSGCRFRLSTTSPGTSHFLPTGIRIWLPFSLLYRLRTVFQWPACLYSQTVYTAEEGRRCKFGALFTCGINFIH